MCRFPRVLAMSIVPLVLSGCSVPLPVQIASLIADGISLLTTEKTLTDHGISAAADKDCAVWRGITGEGLCRQDGDGATLLAEAPADNGGEPGFVLAEAVETVPLPAPEPEPAPAAEDDQEDEAVIAEAGLAEETAAEEAAPPPPPPPPAAEDSGGLHFVLASFSVPGNASRLVSGNRELSPRVVTAVVDERIMHRVVVGPFASEDRQTLRARLAAAGFTDAWAIRLDAGAGRSPG